MNVIRQVKRGGSFPGGPRPSATGSHKPKASGRGAGDFDIIQYRPGQRPGTSTSSSGEMRTPSNLQLQMAISSSAHRFSVHTDTARNLSSSSTSRGRQGHTRVMSASSSGLTTSTSMVTPKVSSMGPPKTPLNNFFTPRNTPRSTPRSTPTSSSMGHDQGNSYVVLAVTEGRGHARGEVGIAVIDIKRPKLILCQISDRQTYANAITKISVFRPAEILVPNTFVESNQPNKLYNMLEEKFPFVNMTKVQRRLFRDSEGLEKVQYLCLPENSSCQLILQDRFYALAAAAALLKYVEFVQNVIFAAHSLKVEYQGAHHGTIIDLTTAKNLELLLNQQSNSATHTLIGIMDHCATHGGSRLLRASLLHPPCSLPIIARRQDGVQELVENPDTGQKIREVLRQLPDVEQLLTLCMQTPSTIDTAQAIETRVNYVLMLKTTLELLPLLAAVLENAKSFILCKAKECLRDPRRDQMKARILETLNEDVKSSKGGKTATFQRCFAVKSGINDFMDIARKTYCELINDMHDHVLDLASKHSLPLKMNYSATKGYHIQITLQKNHQIKISDLPAHFVQAQGSKNNLTCTTNILIHANERIKQVTTDILVLSNSLLTVVLNDIREHIGYLYVMCESIAEVDLILALAQISSSHNYVRPTFCDHLNLKSSRHPVLESITSNDLIANNIEASSQRNVSIITGPNMSGKSIYIRQVLLLQIMAQVGSYVPAEEATFRITDRIFSHLNFDDSLENNASTLSLEMKEMQLILSSVTATSLVALDELCRGTSVEEGTALAWALCEELSQSTAFVFVTTHFLDLTKLASLYPTAVKNVYLETIEQEFSDKKSRLVYTHRLLPGINPVVGYGLRLAENLDIPDCIAKTATEIASQIRSTSNVHMVSTQGDEDYNFAYSFYKLQELAAKDDLTADNLLIVHSELKEALMTPSLERKTSNSHQKTSPIPDSVVADENPKLNTEQLCEYSSSDQDTLSSQRIISPSKKETMASSSSQRATALSPEILHSSILSPYIPDQDAASKLGDLNGDVESTLTSVLDNTYQNDVSPKSLASFCSRSTWRAESPEGLFTSRQVNQIPGEKRFREYSDSSGSECGESADLCSKSDASLNLDESILSSSLLDDMTVFEEETSGNRSFCLSSVKSSQYSKEDLILSEGENSNDLFNANDERPVISNPFRFMNKDAVNNHIQTFETFFKDIGRQNTSQDTNIFPTGAPVTLERSFGDFEHSSSPILCSRRPNPVKKCRPSSTDTSKEAKPEISWQSNPSGDKQVAPIAATGMRPRTSDALQNLANSYCYSDSESD